MPIGATYYTIRIYAGCDGPGGTAKAYEHNMRQAMQDMYGPKEYCEACKDKIEKCIKQCVNHGKDNQMPYHMRRALTDLQDIASLFGFDILIIKDRRTGRKFKVENETNQQR